ncbi:hypothetical protein JKP88DRAFT_250517 [Tribonema minus]|uniref:Uncharacterized protein n=1 Tax=Tribonema minus TaxID=303371 RepID=A0A835YJY8_9STRA|nr:hypothetical protein JKP88DRAFT_250517 [Tribonema minus]
MMVALRDSLQSSFTRPFIQSFLGPADRARQRQVQACLRESAPTCLSAERDVSGAWRIARVSGMIVPLDSTPGDLTAVTLSADDVGILGVFYRRRRTRRAVDVDSNNANAGILAAVHESARAVLWAQQLSSRERAACWHKFGPPWPDSGINLCMDADSHERCAFLSLLLLALRPELSRFEVRTNRALALFGGAELAARDRLRRPRGGAAPESERAGEASVWALQHVDPPAPGDGRILEVIAAVMAARRAGRSDSDWQPLGVVVELRYRGPVRDPVGYAASFGMIEARMGMYDYWHFRTPAQDPRAIELRVTRWEFGSWNIQFSSLGAYDGEGEIGGGGESDGDHEDE